jgi:hypothetical protein
VTHLAEFDARDLHLAAGLPSLFAYCTEVLRLSEHEAYHRILAARTARKHPRILAMLGEGTLNLTTVRLVAPHLTDETADGLLDAAAGRSKRQVEELVARHAPRPDVPSSVRKLPVKTTSAGATSVSSVATPTVPDEVVAVGWPPAVAVTPVTPRARPTVVRPLAPERYEVRFTASAETCAKLRRAQDLLRHAVPNGDTAAIVDRALTLLVADLERKKFATTDRPRPSRAPSSARTAGGARSVASSSSTTSSRMPWAARPPSRTSSCAVAPTTGMRRASSTDRASIGMVEAESNSARTEFGPDRRRIRPRPPEGNRDTLRDLRAPTE